jgi:hypothetical protein
MGRKSPGIRASLVLCGLAIGACAAVRVTAATGGGGGTGGEPAKEATAGVDGIPFYVKRGMWEQTSTYLWRWIHVRLETYAAANDANAQPAAPPAAPVLLGVRHLEVKYVPEAVSAVRQLVDAGARLNEGEDEWSGVMSAWQALEPFRLDPASPLPEETPDGQAPSPLATGEVTLAANTVKAVAVVDYSRRHYVNSITPPFGKAEVTANLAPDGTLTEASGAVEPRLTEFLTGLVPLKELLTFRWVPTAREKGVLAAGERVHRVAISVEERGQLFVFTKLHPLAGGAPGVAPEPGRIPYRPQSGQFSTAPWGAVGGSGKGDAKSAGFVGTVKLPSETGGS